MSTLPDWLTIREAAEEILDVTPQRVHQLIAIYGLITKPLNPRMTLVRRRDIERIAKMERPTGIHRGQTA